MNEQNIIMKIRNIDILVEENDKVIIYFFSLFGRRFSQSRKGKNAHKKLKDTIDLSIRILAFQNRNNPFYKKDCLVILGGEEKTNYNFLNSHKLI